MQNNLKLAHLLGAGTIMLSMGVGAQPLLLSDNEVRIGVLTDMSGIFSDLSGPGSVLAAELAIEDFKKSTKTTFPIKLVFADHQNKADVASTRARQWFDADGVDMIADVPSSAAALAVLNIAKEKGRFAIFSGAASTRITNEECTPSGLHWAYDSYALAASTARAVMKQGGDTWFFLTADYAGGHALEKDAADVVKASGGQVFGSMKHPFSAPDFSSFLLTAQGSKAKVIALANAGNDTTNSIKQAVEFGITKQQILAATLMFITDVHGLGLSKAQNMYLTEAFYWDFDEKTRAWSKRFFEKQKRMPTMVQASVYSSVLHYLKGIAAASTDEMMPVLKKMRSMPVEDMFSRNGKLREDGRMVHDMYLLQVKRPSESKYPWDYYHVRQITPGDQAFIPLEKSTCALLKK